MTAIAAPPRERPILFSGPMVRAILDGSKTQTRRVMKPQPNIFADDPNWITWTHGKRMGGGRDERAFAAHAVDRCLYGCPGDRLWVRETWAPMLVAEDGYVEERYFYAADGEGPKDHRGNSLRWHPSIHMRREVSRLSLEITGVRVGRLRSISVMDVDAEGVWDCGAPNEEYIGEYAKLWDSLNAKRGYGWDVNPWVWVISFRRVA